MRGLQSQMLIWIIMISTIVQHDTIHQNKVPSPEDSQQGMNLRPSSPLAQEWHPQVVAVRLFLCPGVTNVQCVMSC